MRLLAIYLVAACALGAHSQISSETRETIEDVAQQVDSLCESTFGDLIDQVFGRGQRSAVCSLGERVDGLLSPASGCPNLDGDRSNVTITLGLALNCEATAGCQGSQNGVVTDVVQLLQCILTSPNNVLESVFETLQNVISGLGDLPEVGTMAQFILNILGQKLQEVACSGSLSILGIALVLPIVVSILLIGIIIGLIGSPLASVGFLVLGLLPVILLVVFLVSGLLIILSPLLNEVVNGLVLSLLEDLAGLLRGRKVECANDNFATLSSSQILRLIHPPSLTQIFGLLSTFSPAALSLSGLDGLPGLGGLSGLARLGSLIASGGFGGLGGSGGFGGLLSSGGFGGLGGSGGVGNAAGFFG